MRPVALFAFTIAVVICASLALISSQPASAQRMRHLIEFYSGARSGTGSRRRLHLRWLYISAAIAAGVLFVLTMQLNRAGAAAGDLDPTFGAGGKVVTDFRSGVPDQAIGVTLQPDGKIIAVGTTGMQPLIGDPNADTTLADFAVARYNSDGSLDQTFGNGGKVTTDFFGHHDVAFAVKVQTDDKILVVGYAYHPPLDDDVALARYNPDGSLDQGFGNGGKVTTDIFGDYDAAFGVIVLPSGKIIAVGSTWRSASQDDIALVCYNPDGSLDTSFGSGGKVATDMGKNVDDIAVGSLFGSGKIVVVGFTNSTLFSGNAPLGPNLYGDGDFAIARFNLNGSLDTSFGASGKVITDLSGGEDVAVAAALQPDAKIIAAGTRGGTSQDFALVRYNPDGSLDTTFGSGGKVYTDFSGGHDIAFSLGLQPNGKIVATGVVGMNLTLAAPQYSPNTDAPHAQFGLARYNSDGSLDNTFGTGGKIITDFFGTNGFAMGSTQQTDGKIVVVGSVYTSATDSSFALARYLLARQPAIAFTSDRDGNQEIYVMNPDGTGQTRLTNNAASDYQPSFSFDGTKIAFVSNRVPDNDDIYVMNADGTGQTRLTNNPTRDYMPRFSFDGAKIAFVSDRDGNREIYVMNADGTAQTRLTNNTANDSGPHFSPNGSKIVFDSGRDGTREIYVMNADGTAQTRVTNNTRPDLHASFSPNGSKIMFESDGTPYADIYLMNADGSNQTALTNSTANYWDMGFSPDGNKIVFSSDRDASREIYTMNLDGSTLTRLTSNTALDLDPSWGGPPPSTVQFSAVSYNVSEGCTGVNLTVTRSGDTSGPATVDFATFDREGKQRTDYGIGAGTLTFAPGETSKTFALLANEDHHLEGPENFSVVLRDPSDAVELGTQRTTTVTIMDGDSEPPTSNPNDDSPLFVCQHYHDFLNRQPDPGGAAYWTTQITQCGSDPQCIHNKRLDVSNAFFYEQEFQDTGAYVYRVYKLAYGVPPAYNQFMPDRSRVIGGPQLDASKTAFAEGFVKRSDFTAQYPTSLAAYTYVAGLNANIGYLFTPAELTALADGIVGGTETRGTALRKMADNQKVIDAEYNSSFVLTQYFGYLRRDPDQGGYDFWLGQVNRYPIRNVGIQHAMVCSFITSREYQERFSSVVLHSNAECPQ